MDLSVAIRLIQNGIDPSHKPQRWADLGAGKGLFTQALASLLPQQSEIYAIDKDSKAINSIALDTELVKLTRIVRNLGKEEPGIKEMDGILMANALHFLKDQVGFLKLISDSLNPNGRLVIVEYDMDVANQWVPNPVSFNSLGMLADKAGFSLIEKLDQEPSIYNRANIYSALLK
jgi:trans-aconitate methyltransferase